jgi:hypothetical protein
MHGVDAVSKETYTSVKRDLHMNQVDAGRDRATPADVEFLTLFTVIYGIRPMLHLSLSLQCIYRYSVHPRLSYVDTAASIICIMYRTDSSIKAPSPPL